MKAIELKNVSFCYEKGKPILSGVDFDADFGQITLLCGHSGEGKSTLMYILSGIIPNVNYGELEGEILIDGESIKGKKLGYVCRNVGVVLQNAEEQIIQKTVEDEIAFGCENLAFEENKIKKQIEIVCKLLKLDPSWGTRKLSGGQKQRLITASTLAMGQRIVILDEPLANLDKDGAATLMGTLRTLAKSGYCIIVIEHRLDAVMPYVDRVFEVGNGKVREIKDTKEYLSSETSIIPDSCPLYQGGEELLRIENLSFSPKKRGEILKDVNLIVPKGSRCLLLGENGCGKTTLMRLIARLEKPTSGLIRQNIDPSLGKKGKKRKFYKKVGVVYQNPDYQLFMDTVEREIEFGAVSKEYALEIAKLFHLDSLYGRHPQSLSEGQKRKLSIAAILSGKPEVLLLDEPTVGQDYEGLCAMVKILNDIHMNTGNTMIVVTHDVRCASALCDLSFLLKDGVISESGGKELVEEYFSKQR